MKNKELIDEWMKFAQMDYDAALHLHCSMVPEPFEIVCFHCQQSAEKVVKALMLSFDMEIPRTHDLGLLTGQLGERVSFPQEILDACNALTSYAVNIRYPYDKELDIYYVKKAVQDAEKILSWVKEALDKAESGGTESSDA